MKVLKVYSMRENLSEAKTLAATETKSTIEVESHVLQIMGSRHNTEGGEKEKRKVPVHGTQRFSQSQKGSSCAHSTTEDRVKVGPPRSQVHRESGALTQLLNANFGQKKEGPLPEEHFELTCQHMGRHHLDSRLRIIAFMTVVPKRGNAEKTSNL